MLGLVRLGIGCPLGLLSLGVGGPFGLLGRALGLGCLGLDVGRLSSLGCTRGTCRSGRGRGGGSSRCSRLGRRGHRRLLCGLGFLLLLAAAGDGQTQTAQEGDRASAQTSGRSGADGLEQVGRRLDLSSAFFDVRRTGVGLHLGDDVFGAAVETQGGLVHSAAINDLTGQRLHKVAGFGCVEVVQADIALSRDLRDQLGGQLVGKPNSQSGGHLKRRSRGLGHRDGDLVAVQLHVVLVHSLHVCGGDGGLNRVVPDLHVALRGAERELQRHDTREVDVGVAADGGTAAVDQFAVGGVEGVLGLRDAQFLTSVGAGGGGGGVEDAGTGVLGVLLFHRLGVGLRDAHLLDRHVLVIRVGGVGDDLAGVEQLGQHTGNVGSGVGFIHLAHGGVRPHNGCGQATNAKQGAQDHQYDA